MRSVVHGRRTEDRQGIQSRGMMKNTEMMSMKIIRLRSLQLLSPSAQCRLPCLQCSIFQFWNDTFSIFSAIIGVLQCCPETRYKHEVDK